MITLLHDRPGLLDVVVRTAPEGAPRPGLQPGDVVCQLKRAGATRWASKRLLAQSWRDAGQGAYVLALDPGDTDTPGALFVLLEGAPHLVPLILPRLCECEVVPAPQAHAARTDLERTTLVGQIVGLDDRPVGRAAVTARLLQVPLVLAGVAVASDPILTQSDDDGFFALSLLAGATVDLEIPVLRFRRTMVVPQAPAPGVPVRLFAIP
jgi:hypothetical protein